MLKKIRLEEAIGTKLAHDMTEIRPGEFKGAAFQKGHTVCNEDLCRLQKMGKNHHPSLFIFRYFSAFIRDYRFLVIPEAEFGSHGGYFDRRRRAVIFNFPPENKRIA